MITITPVLFDGGIVGEPSETYKSENTPLHKIVVHVIEQMMTHPALRSPQWLGHKIVAESEFAPPVPNKPINIDFVLIDNDEAMSYWDAPSNCLGFHSLTSGVYESEDGDILSTKHRVVMKLCEKQYRRYVLEERQQETDPTSSRHDLEYLISYLVTITHEIAHCVEWISWTNGMTPSDVQNGIEDESIDLKMLDISAGNGIIMEFDGDMSDDKLNHLMEERVEGKGRQWLRDLALDPDLIDEVCEHYAPDSEKL